MQGIRHSLHDVPGLSAKLSNDLLNFGAIVASADKETNENNEDGISLDSLSWSDRDATQDGHHELLLPTLLPRRSRESLLQDLTQKAVEIYETFAFQDPLVALQEEYRLRGIESIDEYFDFLECPETAPRRKRNYRRCEFRCPQSDDVRKVTSSCLPLPFLLMDSYNPPKDFLIEHTLIFFGKFGVFGDGLVYFESRIAAKKSAALKRLLEFHKNYGQSTVLFDSTSEASRSLKQHCTPFQETSTAAPNTATEPREAYDDQRHRRFPEWVNRLHNEGVEGAFLEIQYREDFDPRKHRIAPMYWEGQPTLLRCVMEVSSPIKARVVGLPGFSKKDARESAVKLLIDKLGKNRNHTEDKSGSKQKGIGDPNQASPFGGLNRQKGEVLSPRECNMRADATRCCLRSKAQSNILVGHGKKD